MEIDVTFIRNGLTEYERKGLFIGVTDVPLCEEGKRLLESKKRTGCYPNVERVYTSAETRCRESASILYPGQPAVVLYGFQPYDYGDYEGKSFDQAKADPAFQQWIGGAGGVFPVSAGFHQRMYRAVASFQTLMEECAENDVRSVSVVTHRHAILAVVRNCCVPRQTYKAIPLENGGGLTVSYNNYRDNAVINNYF